MVIAFNRRYNLLDNNGSTIHGLVVYQLNGHRDQGWSPVC